MEEKLIEALRIIREECKSKESCGDCAFCKGVCVINAVTPERWVVKGDEPEHGVFY